MMRSASSPPLRNRLGAHPNSADTDGDGRDDADEWLWNSSLVSKDSDRDGLPDSKEHNWTADTDGDGRINVIDWDSDDDFLADGIEDADQDGVVDGDTNQNHYWNSGETWTETDPLNNDTDGDGLLDGEEDIDRNGKILGDSDNDRVWDTYEIFEETDPLNSNTDGDSGCSDNPEEDAFPLDDTECLDTDNDGYGDNADLDDNGDVMLSVNLYRLKAKGNIDGYWRFRTEADLYFKIYFEDEWDSKEFIRYKDEIESNEDVVTFEVPLSIPMNIPDDERYISISIKLKDNDPGRDDRLDITPLSGETLQITYDIVNDQWDGGGENDVSSGVQECIEENDGKSDDGKICFAIEKMYELSRADQITLKNKFSPKLYFDDDENFFPMKIGPFLSNSKLYGSSGDEYLSPTQQDLIDENNKKSYLDLFGEDTVCYYIPEGGPPAGSCIVIDRASPTNALKTYSEIQDNNNYDVDAIYSRVFTTIQNTVIIQYWFFYAYNDWYNDHEGDWEFIQVTLPTDSHDNINQDPVRITYSQHYSGEQYSWTNSIVEKNGNHPKVAVAQGSHASYFEIKDDTRYSYILPEKTGTDGGDGYSNDQVILLTNQVWLSFKGMWGYGGGGGSSSDGPPGPVFRHSKPTVSLSSDDRYAWIDPLFWERNKE